MRKQRWTEKQESQKTKSREGVRKKASRMTENE